MKKHPEIKWTEIFRESIRNYLQKLEKPRKISGKELFKQIHLKSQKFPLDQELEFREKQKTIEKKRIHKIIEEENKARGV